MPRRPDFLFATTYPIAFDEARLERAPLGGSETALVEVSRLLARRGLAVEVYAPCPRPGSRAGVRWARVSGLARDLEAGKVRPRVLVICRDAALAPLARHAEAAWLWLQDMPMEGLRGVTRAAVPLVQRVLCISDYQLRRFTAVHGLDGALVEQRFTRTRNGVDLTPHHDLLAGAATRQGRVPGRCVYASAPFRGLAHLLAAWPEIHRLAPHATLEVLGGMAAYDQDDAPFAHLYQRARSLPGVTVAGALPQAGVMAALRRAELLLYPCSFREAGCIVLLMALAAGAVPVTSDIACLPEYVADAGVVVAGNPRPGGQAAWEFLQRFCAEAAALLADAPRREALRRRCTGREVDWGPVLDQWLGSS